MDYKYDKKTQLTISKWITNRDITQPMSRLQEIMTSESAKNLQLQIAYAKIPSKANKVENEHA